MQCALVHDFLCNGLNSFHKCKEFLVVNVLGILNDCSYIYRSTNLLQIDIKYRKMNPKHCTERLTANSKHGKNSFLIYFVRKYEIELASIDSGRVLASKLEQS